MSIKWKDFAKRNLNYKDWLEDFNSSSLQEQGFVERKAVRAAKSKSEQPPPEPRKVAAIPIEGTQNRALSIRQPYVEQIMRGTKVVEYRGMLTHIRGRVYIYASLTPGPDYEFSEMSAKPGDFQTGAIVGTVEIIDCTGVPGDYEWHLAHPIRLDKPLKPKSRPQPSWFIPFEK